MMAKRTDIIHVWAKTATNRGVNTPMYDLDKKVREALITMVMSSFSKIPYKAKKGNNEVTYFFITCRWDDIIVEARLQIWELKRAGYLVPDQDILGLNPPTINDEYISRCLAFSNHPKDFWPEWERCEEGKNLRN